MKSSVRFIIFFVILWFAHIVHWQHYLNSIPPAHPTLVIEDTDQWFSPGDNYLGGPGGTNMNNIELKIRDIELIYQEDGYAACSVKAIMRNNGPDMVRFQASGIYLIGDDFLGRLDMDSFNTQNRPGAGDYWTTPVELPAGETKEYTLPFVFQYRDKLNRKLEKENLYLELASVPNIVLARVNE